MENVKKEKEKKEENEIEVKEPLQQFVVIQDFRITDKDMQIIPKDIDKYGKLQWKNKSILTIDKLYIFEDILFENIIDDYLYRVKSAGENLEELAVTIDEILKETK